MKISRRTVLSGLAAVPFATQDSKPHAALATVMLRANGKQVPKLGIGCSPLATLPDAEAALAILGRAFDAGVRYVDTAPSYSNGASERRIGQALRGRKRAEFCLATKTLRRDADGARRELEESLRRLGVERLDCLQVHEIHEDVADLDEKKGVLAALCKARDEKLIESIGVTCHRDPRFAQEALRRFPFVQVLCPVNAIDPLHRSFVREFLPYARERQTDVIAMKVFAGGSLPQRRSISAADCLRYALSREGVTVVVPGWQSVAQVDEALQVARGFAALGTDRIAALEASAAPHEKKRSEWYKNE